MSNLQSDETAANQNLDFDGLVQLNITNRHVVGIL